MRLLPAMLCLAALACGSDPIPLQGSGADTVEDTDDSAESELSNPLAYLARLSLDLRGIRPSPEEIALVDGAADPSAAIDGLIDSFLQDERFPERMAWLWNDALHTAVWGASYDRFGELEFESWRAMGQEPLQYVRLVVAEGRPVTHLVTVQAVPANPALAELWGLSYAGTGEAWAWASWNDSRPVAGMLSSTSLWLRYTADRENYNRHRANAASRIFLCTDFLDRDGAFVLDLDASDLAEVERAVAVEPACLGCHAALDPLAGFFGGFAERSVEQDDARFVQWSEHDAAYHAARRAPAYFGHPGNDLVDLGAMIAADPRFTRCAAQRFAEGLLRETLSDPLELEGLARDLTEEDLVVRRFVGRVVRSERYREAFHRRLTVEQLQTVLQDLTGWGAGDGITDGLNAVTWSVEHRVMGGSTDDVTVTERNEAPGVGMHVLLEWTGRQLAEPALEADLAREATDRRLLTLVSEGTTDEADVRAQLALWHTHFLTLPVDTDSAEVDALYALWLAAGGAEDPMTGWATALSALVRHPAMVLY